MNEVDLFYLSKIILSGLHTQLCLTRYSALNMRDFLKAVHMNIIESPFAFSQCMKSPLILQICSQRLFCNALPKILKTQGYILLLVNLQNFLRKLHYILYFPLHYNLPFHLPQLVITFMSLQNSSQYLHAPESQLTFTK